ARVRGESLPSVGGTPMSPDGLPVPSETYYEDGDGSVLMPGEMSLGDYCNPCRGGCGGWGVCAWVPVCIFVPRLTWDGLEFFGGVQGFTGLANRGGSGSFGFHEGFNWGLPLGGLA